MAQVRRDLHAGDADEVCDARVVHLVLKGAGYLVAKEAANLLYSPRHDAPPEVDLWEEIRERV
jgi:hypothetical protein